MQANIGDVILGAILVQFLFYLWNAAVSRVSIKN